MAIGTRAQVKSMLGIPTATTTYDAFIDEILDAVDDWVEHACSRQFSNATYLLEEYGTDDKILSLPNRPINGLLWVGTGKMGVITVEYTGSYTGMVSVENKKVVVAENLSKTEINLTASGISTISDVATAINALSGWTASASTIYASYPALILLNRNYDFVVSTSGQFEMVAATSPIDLQRVRDGGYRWFNRRSSADIVLIIYDGGYSTMPDGLIMVCSKIAADAYSFLTRDGALKKEELGDYMYELESKFRNDAINANWQTLVTYANIPV